MFQFFDSSSGTNRSETKTLSLEESPLLGGAQRNPLLISTKSEMKKRLTEGDKLFKMVNDKVRLIGVFTMNFLVSGDDYFLKRCTCTSQGIGTEALILL